MIPKETGTMSMTRSYLLLGAHTIGNVRFISVPMVFNTKDNFTLVTTITIKTNGALVTDRLVEDGGKRILCWQRRKWFDGAKYFGRNSVLLITVRKVKVTSAIQTTMNLLLWQRDWYTVTGKYSNTKITGMQNSKEIFWLENKST